MADNTIVGFRSKHRNHRIKSGGLDIRFVMNCYRTSIPGEIALLRERAAEANSPIIELKPEERVTLKIERAPAGPSKGSAKNAKVDPVSLDVPEAETKK